MNRDDYWNNFIKSGSVEDYLKFAGYREQAELKEETDNRVIDHAGLYHDNRNGAESGTLR